LRRNHFITSAGGDFLVHAKFKIKLKQFCVAMKESITETHKANQKQLTSIALKNNATKILKAI